MKASTGYVCIPQSKNNDPNYRYKMPVMRLSQESRLNGAKTNINNLSDVAAALRVPESAILKYFCSEVGANSEGQTIIKGTHTLNDLNRHLDKFIMKYVCCKRCKLPELTYKVQKKSLSAICKSCGNTDSQMDTIHKAGKQLHKEIPNFQSNNQDIIVNSAPEPVPDNQNGRPATQGKKKKKRQSAAGDGDQALAQGERAQQKKVKDLMANGGEINSLDSAELDLTSQLIQNACEELKTFVEEQEAAGEIDCKKILNEARQMQLQLNITPDYKLYICMCGIFGPHRNIVKHWDTFEPVFTNLVEADAENGTKRLMQCVFQFFVNRYPDQQKFAAAFCKKLYDNSVISDELFISWHARKIKFDRHSKLADANAGKKMRTLLQEFIDWLQSAEYDDETAYGQEAVEEEKKEEDVEETEQERVQRELIEAQKRAQAERAAAALAAGDQKKKAAAEATTEEEKNTDADADNLEKIQATDVAKIQVEDEFDIDDI